MGHPGGENVYDGIGPLARFRTGGLKVVQAFGEGCLPSPAKSSRCCRIFGAVIWPALAIFAGHRKARMSRTFARK